MRSVTLSVTQNPRSAARRISQHGRARRYGFARNVIVVLLGCLVPGCALAVPIPWKNCGAAGDRLSISQSDASMWPPSVAAPVRATATFDTAGELVNLRIFMVHGVAWTFDSGPLPTTTSGGFVSLPASFPVTLRRPALPLPAGPYFIDYTFGTHGAPSTTIVDKANLFSTIVAPVTATASLAFGGTPGFPLTPIVGAYQVHLELDESGGPRVFCADFNVPLKSGKLVDVVGTSTVPSVSSVGLALVALGVGVCGAFAARRRVRALATRGRHEAV